MIVHCATTNPGKLREFRLAGAAFDAGRFTVEPLPGLRDISAPDETGSTFEENAIQKAVYYGAHTAEWLFVDDSGLEVDALGGEPGVVSARYAGANATDDDNNALLLQKVGQALACQSMLDAGGRPKPAAPPNGAQFVCVIALVRNGELMKTFRGVVRGTIVDAPRGPNGFGYDPLFFYEPFGCTFGEADTGAKMQVSHRAQALRQMFSWLAGHAAS